MPRKKRGSWRYNGNWSHGCGGASAGGVHWRNKLSQDRRVTASNALAIDDACPATQSSFSSFHFGHLSLLLPAYAAIAQTSPSVLLVWGWRVSSLRTGQRESPEKSSSVALFQWCESQLLSRELICMQPRWLGKGRPQLPESLPSPHSSCVPDAAEDLSQMYLVRQAGAFLQLVPIIRSSDFKREKIKMQPHQTKNLNLPIFWAVYFNHVLKSAGGGV